MLIMQLAFSLVFTPYLSNSVVSANPHISFHALAALKMLVSLISRLIACSARIVGDKHTNRQTDTQTHRPSTVTLAAHARRWLIMLVYRSRVRNGVINVLIQFFPA